jgi:hypothetical protein
MLARGTASTSNYPATPGGVQVRIPSFWRYFLRYFPRNLLASIAGILVGAVLMTLVHMAEYGDNSTLFPYPHLYLLYLFVFPFIVCASSFHAAQRAAQRAPLLDFSQVNSPFAWVYVDLAARYADVFETCEQLVRELTRGNKKLVLATDPAMGVIIGEISLNSMWQSEDEVNFRLERFWSQDAGHPIEITRVQILSRAPVPSRPPSAKVVRSLIQALKDKYPTISEGPEGATR